MADNYADYSRDQLLRLLRERDRAPRFGLVWERDEIAHETQLNHDFVALDCVKSGPGSNYICLLFF